MDIFDVLWNASQDKEIVDVRKQVERLQLDRDEGPGTTRIATEMRAENDELKIRLGLLVRLLIAKGVITAEEYATLIQRAKAAD
jgi:hypothetical protein